MNEKLKRDVMVMERVQLANDLLTELRKQINEIERDYFDLIGKEFGELTVVHRRDRTKVADKTETWIAGWRCHCTCGEYVDVTHIDLNEGNVTHCGGESHTTEFVEL